MTNAIAAYARQTIRDTTAMGMDYDLDELDDLGSRKQEVPVSGDDLACIVRAQRGAAHVSEQVDPYPFDVVVQATARALWYSAADVTPGRGNRRMAAVGFSNGPVGLRSRIITDGISPTVLD